ncbi:PH domain-containing protein [Halocatena salina]|uniref:PH domain-containing protein n=1 Tax=Halocatena salina TaxID=2934340 RepID=A0A8T9ZZT2_9EURY|nr:PH domain-containing protein [Halocatena salina]UPM41979.1 PH domain-containing protein [Halocatena salina]
MKLHPLSGVWNALGRGVNVGSFGFFLGMMGVAAMDGPILLVFGLAALGFVLGVGYGAAYYLVFEYELTTETFDVTSGVLNRQHREIPFHRIQNIDVTQSLGKRLFGVAVLTVETAGGGSTEITLDFVSEEKAAWLQSTVRDRKRAAGGDDTTVTEDTDTTIDTDQSPRPLFELQSSELAVLAVAFLRPGAFFIALFGVPLMADLGSSLLLSIARPFGGPEQLSVSTLSPDSAIVLALVGIPLVIAGAWVVSALVTVVEYFGFKLGRAGEDLVYQRGLLQRYSGTIPVEKVQSLTITEPVLARPLGYAGLSVETAGYAPGQANEQGSQSAIPLSNRSRVFELAHEIEPFEDPTFVRLPKRARRRYFAQYLLVVGGLIAVGYLLSQVLGGFTLWYLPAVVLPITPIAAHYKWKHRGYHVGEEHVAFRTGYWRRTTQIVPYYRLQAVFTSRTIFQRRLGLATLTVDIASSTTLGGNSPTAYDINSDTADRLYTLLGERLQRTL